MCTSLLIYSLRVQENEFKFGRFRINDVSATPENIELRRAVPVGDFGERATYNVRIPLKKTPVFSLPPFEIMQCSVLIELSTNSIEYVKNVIATTNVPLNE